VTLPGDTTRLAPYRVVPEPERTLRVNWLVGEASETGMDPLPSSVFPVAAFPQLSFVLSEMPHRSEWGVVPEEDELGALPRPPLLPLPPGLYPRGSCGSLRRQPLAWAR
jgi:hypothetical protein